MRCGCYVKWEERRAKGSGKPYMKARLVAMWANESKDDTTPFNVPGGHMTHDELIADGCVLCDGAIKVEVRADEEPYMGGCSAVLEIDTFCQACGSTAQPTKIGTYGGHLTLSSWLRDYEGANTLLTEAVAAMPQPVFTKEKP